MAMKISQGIESGECKPKGRKELILGVGGAVAWFHDE